MILKSAGFILVAGIAVSLAAIVRCGCELTSLRNYRDEVLNPMLRRNYPAVQSGYAAVRSAVEAVELNKNEARPPVARNFAPQTANEPEFDVADWP